MSIMRYITLLEFVMLANSIAPFSN